MLEKHFPFSFRVTANVGCELSFNASVCERYVFIGPLPGLFPVVSKATDKTKEVVGSGRIRYEYL